MVGQIIIIAVILGVVSLFYYLWKHRAGRLARGIGAAGSEYNMLYGQGAAPEIPPPAVRATPTRPTGPGTGESR